MSAVVVVSGLLEGLQLVTNLLDAASAASKAIQTAQTTGQPVDFTGILGSIDSHEAAVLASIAAAKAAGH
jgi:hypothetical protein